MKDNYLKKELYELVKNDSSIFEFIQAGSLDGMWYWDLIDPKHEWMSDKFWTTLGFNPNEKKHLACEWQDLIFAEDLKIAKENLERHIENPNHPYDQIVRYRHKNGSTVWIRCRGLAIRDEQGKAIRMLGAHTDITHMKETEREITRLTAEYEKVFNGTQDAMFLIEVKENRQFTLIRNNLSHQIRTGIGLDQLKNKTPQELLGVEMGDRVSRNYQMCVEKKTRVTYEEELSLPAGNRIWLTTLTPIFDGPRITHIVGSSTDITKRKELELELAFQANHDALTALPNRRLFFETLEKMIGKHEKHGRRFALLFIDLDGFKTINDRHGHAIGDKVLQHVGERLASCVKTRDTAARIGGDEFTAIIENLEDEKSIDDFTNMIFERIREVFRIGDIECQIQASIGLAIYPQHGKDSETLLRHADQSMYQIKKKNAF
jgi:diguanylate cyclase (GGDEF)-like protein/PAS domain S-box-containing protein